MPVLGDCSEREDMIVLMLIAALAAVSEKDLLPLNETVLLNTEVVIGDDILNLYKASDLVFSVRSVTRQLSILGWASERYDLEVGNVFKGHLDLESVSLFTFPCGMYSSQLSSLKEGQGLIVFAVPDTANTSMEGFNTAEESWIAHLCTQ